MKTDEAFEILKNAVPGDNCLICHGIPSLIGIFIPDDSVLYGGISEKQRMFRYCLCKTCSNLKDVQKKIEEIIFGNRTFKQ